MCVFELKSTTKGETLKRFLFQDVS